MAFRPTVFFTVRFNRHQPPFVVGLAVGMAGQTLAMVSPHLRRHCSNGPQVAWLHF
jgi:uncharacterized membrane protein YjjB (DUF3815 family)